MGMIQSAINNALGATALLRKLSLKNEQMKEAEIMKQSVERAKAKVDNKAKQRRSYKDIQISLAGEKDARYGSVGQLPEALQKQIKEQLKELPTKERRRIMEGTDGK